MTTSRTPAGNRTRSACRSATGIDPAAASRPARGSDVRDERQRELDDIPVGVLGAGSELIEPRDLALGEAGGAAAASTAARPTGAMSLAALEREHILAVLGEAETLEVAAKQLGIDASTLYRKRKQYGI